MPISYMYLKQRVSTDKLGKVPNSLNARFINRVFNCIIGSLGTFLTLSVEIV